MIRSQLIGLFSISFLCLFLGCNSDSGDPAPTSTLIVRDFNASITEFPQQAEVIGRLSATGGNGTLTFTLVEVNPQNAIVISNSGEVLVADSSAFDAAVNPVITAQVEVTDGIVTRKASIQITIEEPSFTIWSGTKITFEKADGVDPSLEANQDRITELVWITRGNNGGQIYNAKTETSADQAVSPEGTRWALGTTDNLPNLTFAPLRTTIKPSGIVGNNLVLHLVEENIYIDIIFTSWSANKQGGFAYERATE